MKKLSIEQKAQRYDEAIKKLQEIITMDNKPVPPKEIGVYLFPELRESKDERIRKSLIDYFKNRKDDGDIDETWYGISYDEILAWLETQGNLVKHYEDKLDKCACDNFNKGYKKALEAQGEHANFRNAIQVGDKVTRNRDGVLVNLSQLNRVAKKQGEQKPDTDFSDLRNWKYIVDAVLTKENGIGNYFDSARTEAIAKELQERFGKIEQKPVDKVEPKFKVGDWIIDVQGVSANQIIGYEDDSYHIKTSCSKFYLPMKLTEKNYRLWTIQDAKEGDVLSWDDSKCITLFKNIYDEESFNSYGFLGHCTGAFEPRQSYHDIEGVHPATKEQRDTLEKAMADAGYRWNADERKLEKIEQKPAWSEEDEVMIKVFDSIIRYIVEVLNKDVFERFGTNSEELFSWLKSLKDRVQPQPKQEWNEEDKETIDLTIAVLKENLPNGYFKTNPINTLNMGGIHTDELIEKLKSLSPQNRLKPSDEQIKALETVLYTNMSRNDERYSVLSEFVAELKKQKG